ncbi:hypothetical protein MMC07_006293 [Pseudocyphellaria aurata]|nr:hypothetical protein [Pseudocyphellaria aurata]
MSPSRNHRELGRRSKMEHNGYRPHRSSVPHRHSQNGPSIPTLSLTDEGGSSCPIYTPEESIRTPLRSVQADSMVDNGYPESDGLPESRSLDRRPFHSNTNTNNHYSTSEIPFDHLVASEALSSDQGNSNNIDWSAEMIQTRNVFDEAGAYMYPSQENPGDTAGGPNDPIYTTANIQMPLSPSNRPRHATASVTIFPPDTGIVPMPGVWRHQNHDGFMSNAFQSPPHIPDLSSGPWTPYSCIHDQSHEPSPSENLFAPGQSPTRGANWSIRSYQGEGHEIGDIAHQNKHVPNFEVDDDEDGAVSGQPPSESFGNSAQVSAADVRKIKKKGGRRSKLSTQAKEHARKKRSTRDTCWHCRMLRISCDCEKGSDMCNGCKTMRASGWHWGCLILNLPDLTDVFLPASLLEQHHPDRLRRFASQHIRRWMDNFMVVHVGWGHGELIVCEVQEIEPEGDHLLSQHQYKLNEETGEYDTVRVLSPPIGMMLMSIEDWRKKLDTYLNETLESHFDNFPERCFRGRDMEVQKDLLYELHCCYLLGAEKENDLWRHGFKLVIVTQIMTHTLTLVDENEVFRKLKNTPPRAYGIHTSSRWLNKELKFLFSLLHQTQWKAVLDKLQLILQSSKKKSAWCPAFVALLLLAMMTESMQIQIRCKEETDKTDGTIARENNVASSDIGLMEEKWEVLRDLFHKKYKGFNPIYQDRDQKDLEDASMQRLAQQVKALTEKYGEQYSILLSFETFDVRRSKRVPRWCTDTRLPN